MQEKHNYENDSQAIQADNREQMLNDIEINSNFSKKTYIFNLQKAIDEEKERRLELEKQIEEIKKLNSEISSQLGLKLSNN